MWKHRESKILVRVALESDANMTVAFCVNNSTRGRHGYGIGRCLDLQAVAQHNGLRNMTFGTFLIYQSLQRNIVHREIC